MNQIIKTRNYDKNLFLIKNFYFLDTFLNGFFLKPKLNKSFPFLRFNIYFKINLVLPLRFKIINVKNLHSKKHFSTHKLL